MRQLGPQILKRNYKAKRLIFTTDLKKAVSNSDVIFICVGTPTKKKSNSADLKYVYSVANELKKIISKYKIIITKSTVPVTTGDRIEKILNNLKKKKLVDIVSNPEFLREGEAIRDFIYPDRVIIGTDSKKANRILRSLYLPIIKKTSRYFNTSRRGAEMIKYASNAFLATKISYINELANLCEKTGVDVKDISFGMGSDQRIGERFLRAGPAYGGSCFPKDTKALIDIANKFKTNLSIVKSVVKSNNQRKFLLINKVEKILNRKFRNKNKSTDILSFPLNKKIKFSKNTYLGDIIISYNYLNKPKSLDLVSFKQKTIKIFIHGFLHLLGFNHIKNKDYSKMLREENLLFKAVKSKIYLN